jgi:hypothetical protein
MLLFSNSEAIVSLISVAFVFIIVLKEYLSVNLIISKISFLKKGSPPPIEILKIPKRSKSLKISPLKLRLLLLSNEKIFLTHFL